MASHVPARSPGSNPQITNPNHHLDPPTRCFSFWFTSKTPKKLEEGATNSKKDRPIWALKGSKSKPGIKMVYPEPCKEFRRRPQLFMVGIIPYQPSSTRVWIVARDSKCCMSCHLGPCPGFKTRQTKTVELRNKWVGRSWGPPHAPPFSQTQTPRLRGSDSPSRRCRHRCRTRGSPPEPRQGSWKIGGWRSGVEGGKWISAFLSVCVLSQPKKGYPQATQTRTIHNQRSPNHPRISPRQPRKQSSFA